MCDKFLGISLLIGPQFLQECVRKIGERETENWLIIRVIFLDQSETINTVKSFIKKVNNIVMFHGLEFMQYTDSGVLSSCFP